MFKKFEQDSSPRRLLPIILVVYSLWVDLCYTTTALSVPVANLGMQVAIKWKRMLLLETSLPSNFDQIEALARDGLSTMKFWNDISVESSRMNSLYWRWPYWSFPSVTSLLAEITGSGESDWPSVLGNMGNHSALQLSPRLNLLIYVLSY